MKFSKKLFFLWVFLLPLNLGNHFVFNFSYVNGRLVDYLIPTIFATDILGLLILGVSLVEPLDTGRLKKLFLGTAPGKFIVLFVAALGFSVLASSNRFISFYIFSKTVLYLLLGVYIALNFDPGKDTLPIVQIFGVSIFLLSILAVSQWFKQGSIFDNYLFFGEQPYSVSTKGVIRESFFGFSRVPPYGLFSHPNVFGGFLALGILYVLGRIVARPYNVFWGILPLVFGSAALFLTFSVSAWIGFLVGVLGGPQTCRLYTVPACKRWYKLLSLGVFLTGVLLWRVGGFSDMSLSSSISRRIDLLQASVKMIADYPLFGVGPGNNVALMERYQVLSGKPRYVQPVHNIFILIFAQSGVFAFLFFLFFIVSLYKTTAGFYKILLVVICVLGLFDHYFWTIHQTQQLFWLTLGCALSTILVNEK